MKAQFLKVELKCN